jgi:hypothetical protein
LQQSNFSVIAPWPDELLKMAEESGFDAVITSDQNIRYQQNLMGRKFALIVLGSNIWPVVRNYGMAIPASADAATPESYTSSKYHSRQSRGRDDFSKFRFGPQRAHTRPSSTSEWPNKRSQSPSLCRPSLPPKALPHSSPAISANWPSP